MVESFPLGYMHLVCLGVVKKLIVNLWSCGKPATKLSFSQISHVSKLLTDLAGSVPVEFNCKPRSLSEAKMWKATELRQFLFYTGPVVLKQILDGNRYLNFLSLHVSMTILSSNKFADLLDYAEVLLKYFVETFITLYGKEHVSHNIHNLLHITNDVRKFGPLDKFSAFSFENYMQVLLKLIRKQDKPLEQIVRRRGESEIIVDNTRNVELNYPICQNKQRRGPVILNEIVISQYEKVIFKDFVLKATKPDNICALKDGSVISIKKIISTEDGIKIVGCQYLVLEDFYEKPCKSSALEIFVVSQNGPIKSWPLNEVAYKCMKLELDDKDVVFPLLHLEVISSH